MENNEILLTPAALLDFLRQVEELSDKDITINETDTAVVIGIGESTYSIDLDTAEDVEVPDEVVEEVSEISDMAYGNLEAEGVEYSEVSDEETVEGGIISETLKTLAIGGLVRLTGKVLGDDFLDKLKK